MKLRDIGSEINLQLKFRRVGNARIIPLLFGIHEVSLNRIIVSRGAFRHGWVQVNVCGGKHYSMQGVFVMDIDFSHLKYILLNV